MEMINCTYLGRHAELYDIFYSDKPYYKEAEFVHECLQKFSTHEPKKILELACGTGNHSFLLEKYGYKIVATDYSKDMLKQANNKAIKYDSNINFYQGDMVFLNITSRPFDAILCLFDSIGYVQSNEKIHSVMVNVNKHLHDEGLFIFEFWHAAAMINGYDPMRVRRWSLPEGEIIRISETHLDIVKQLANVDYNIYELSNNGTYKHSHETHVNRYFLIQEMSIILFNSGLKPLKWFAGYEFNEEITRDVWHIVAVAQKLA